MGDAGLRSERWWESTTASKQGMIRLLLSLAISLTSLCGADSPSGDCLVRLFKFLSCLR